MFDNDSFMTIVFRLLNFALVVGAIVYIFKKYIYDMLENRVATELNEQNGLEEKQQLLESQLVDYQDQVRNQQALCKDLRVKVHLWREARENLQKNIIKERHAIIDAMQKRHEIQSKNVHDAKYRAHVYRHALKEAKKELENQFNNVSSNKKYVRSVVDVLQGRS